MAPSTHHNGTVRLQAQIRTAAAPDCNTIAAIHSYYASTTATMSNRGQSAEDIKNSMSVMASLGLPMLVASAQTSHIHPMAQAKVKKSRIFAATGVPEMPLSPDEDRTGTRIVGYAVTVPHQMASQIEGYARTAEVYIYVAPRYVHRGVGKALATVVVSHLTSLGTPGADGKLVPRWRSLVAVMLARTGSLSSENDPLAGHELGPADDDAQKRVWERLGFAEAGRLKRVLEKGGLWRDIRYFQMDLLG